MSGHDENAGSAPPGGQSFLWVSNEQRIFGRNEPPKGLPFVLLDGNGRPACVSGLMYDFYHESGDDEDRLEQFGISIDDY